MNVNDGVGEYLFDHVKQEVGAVSGLALMPADWCGPLFAYLPPWEGHEAELWTVNYLNRWYRLYEGVCATDEWLGHIVPAAVWCCNDGDEEFKFPEA